MPIMKLAGHLPLQEMIAQTIDTARAQMSASSEKRASASEYALHGNKDNPLRDPKVREKLKGMSAKEQASFLASKSKTSSVIDFRDPDQIEKLASALESVGDDFLKEADSIENGGESHQGGMQLPTGNAVGGHQSYKKDGSKKHAVPMSSGMQASSDGGGATQMPNDAHKAPGGAPYPAKGAMKTAADSVMAKIEAKKKAKHEDKESKEEEKEEHEKKSSALEFLTSKLAESAQGGDTGDSASGSGPKPPSNPGRQYIESNSAATGMKKVDGKGPQKRMLSEVLTEPAMSRSTDSTVQENLRNASAGGVKIAAARAYLQKIASDPSDPRHEKLKEAFAKAKMEKKTMAGGMGTSPMPMGGSTPPMAGM